MKKSVRERLSIDGMGWGGRLDFYQLFTLNDSNRNSCRLALNDDKLVVFFFTL